MSFKYENSRDANQHLQNTVIMYAGVPALVHEVHEQGDGTFSIVLSHLPRMNNRITVDLFSPDLQIRGLQLGYCNASSIGRAVWMSRIPSRQYHQGFCRGNVNIRVDRVSGVRPISWENCLREPGFSDSLRNVYPNLQESIRLLDNPEYRSVAFHRRYAVEKDELDFYRLHYKGEPVAIDGGGNGVFRLAKKFDFLREELVLLGVQMNDKA